MNQRLIHLRDYLLDRLREPSTWAGLAGILTLAHVHLGADQMAGVTALGVGLSSLAAVLLKG